MNKMGKTLVSVIMITYAHENFIRKAVEGVLDQEGDVDFELIIANDSSPDKTHLIIVDMIQNHEEGNKIKYFHHKKNLGMMPNLIFALKQAKGKFVAMCEGDDIWIDSLKLRKQINFMEENQEYTLCGTRTKRVGSEGNISENYGKIIGDVTLDQILRQNQFGTCTVVIRAEALESPPFPNFFDYFTADWPLWCSLLAKGRGCNLDFVSAHYNVHEGGATSGRSRAKTLQNKLEDRILMIDNFPEKKKIIKDYGKKIIFHFLWRSILLQNGYYKAIINNRKVILKFLSY